MHQGAFREDAPSPPPPPPHQGEREIEERNTADGTDRKKKKIDKKDGYNIVLGYFPVTTKQNISVQIVNFSSFPFKSGGEKNTFFYNKICGFFGFLLFLT